MGLRFGWADFGRWVMVSGVPQGQSMLSVRDLSQGSVKGWLVWAAGGGFWVSRSASQSIVLPRIGVVRSGRWGA
jgi:hypothetical protein